MVNSSFRGYFGLMYHYCVALIDLTFGGWKRTRELGRRWSSKQSGVVYFLNPLLPFISAFQSSIIIRLMILLRTLTDHELSW
jgi:hypothetical protein